MSLRWGLCRGLLSGLLNTTTGVPKAPAKALALFTLWASVSTSLQR